ncbi:DUF4431 domain-containing protein [Escherichia albertii]
MRILILLMMMFCANIYAEKMQWLGQQHPWNMEITQSLARETRLAQTSFETIRLYSGFEYTSEKYALNLVYFCGAQKLSEQGASSAKERFHIYDRIFLYSVVDGWITAAQFDKEAATSRETACRYGEAIAPEIQKLLADIAIQSHSKFCRSVPEGDPLRRQLLDALRRAYIGDSNKRKLNSVFPAVEFVAERLCATANYALFYGYVSGEPPNPYWHKESHVERTMSVDGMTMDILPNTPHRYEKRFLDVILEKNIYGIWQTIPQNYYLTQQTTLAAWFDNRPGEGYWNGSLHHDPLFSTTLAKVALQREQRCAREGDTLSVTGLLHQKGEGKSAYWIITPDKPLFCVRDVDTRGRNWNRQLQLVLTADERSALRYLLDKSVVVGGDLFLALGDMHHTPLLLDNIFLLTQAR